MRRVFAVFAGVLCLLAALTSCTAADTGGESPPPGPRMTRKGRAGKGRRKADRSR